MTRTAGSLLIGAAALICIVGTIVLVSQMTLAQEPLQPAAAVLGFVLMLVVIVGPLAGIGVLTLTRSRSEQVEQAEADKMRTILDMVKTRGRVNISDVIIQLNSDMPSVQAMIYRLVGMGVFSGYVNWDEGVLYSEEASELRNLTQCKNCGGNLTLAGKGVIKCPFCGTEYFLAQ